MNQPGSRIGGKLKASFMLLCHGRVGTASLLETLQEFDEVFVPSYWHTDPLMFAGDFSPLMRNDSRLSGQYAWPMTLDNICLGVINHNFPIRQSNAEKIYSVLNNILKDGAHIFLWARDPIDNMISSYRTYLTNYYIFQCCEGNKNATGIYEEFSGEAPLGFASFVESFHYIVNYEAQRSLHQQAGYTVHIRPYTNLQNDLRREVEFVLTKSGIAFSSMAIKHVEYPRDNSWAIQVSFAFRNKYYIDGLPLNVGYFNPARNHPNQGALTLEISHNIFVAPDQWFRIPAPYKKRIQAMKDPWLIVSRTRQGYLEFDANVRSLVDAKLISEGEENFSRVAEDILIKHSVRLDWTIGGV